jgi:uncharacterized cupin superfamily protein
VREAAWVTNEAFGARCLFEADVPALRLRPDLEPLRFGQLGFRVAVFEPGTPSGLYHSDSAQEDFLVLAGQCTARIEEQERLLRQWDFLHCPPGTRHSFVGVGDDPCLLLMVGARVPGKTVEYPEQGTTSVQEAYAGYPHWRPGPRPGAFS